MDRHRRRQIFRHAHLHSRDRGDCALNHRLPEDLWEASCNLCRNPPSVIAASWKSFHFQDGLRLRFASLFNVEHFESGRMAEALGHPDDITGYCLRRRAGAGEQIDRVLAIALELKGVALYRLDREAEAADTLDEAIARLHELVNIAEDDGLQGTLVEALVTFGNALFALERHEQAAAAYESAVHYLQMLIERGENEDRIATLAQVWANKIRALAQFDRLTECAREYNRACEVCPELLQIADWTELARDLEQALAEENVNPDRPDQLHKQTES